MVSHPPRSMTGLTSMWIFRELDKVLQDLTPLEDQGAVTVLLESTAGVNKLSDSIEDIRTAVMAYQVCPPNTPTNHI